MHSASDEIRSRVNIVDIIGEYIKLQKAGANWKALCPFHHEKSPSFLVSEDKQIWHCFGCGKGGDIFGFVMEIEGVEFREALKILAEKSGVDLRRFSSYIAPQSDDKAKVFEILELATKFYEKQLWDGMGKGKIIPYLAERGFKEPVLREFRVGYAPKGWRNVMEFLASRGYTTQDIEKTGLLVKKEDASYYDRFRDRIMFPISDVMGHIVGFSARVTPGADESHAKYINTPETMVYHKSNVLYGIDKAKRAIKDSNKALVVEGNMDVIAAHQAGAKNTIAVSGTALTPMQLDILKRYSNNVAMLYDMDEAGRDATLRSAILCFQKDINVKIVTLPQGKDAAELCQKDPKGFIQAVEKAQSAMDYFFQYFLSKFDKNTVEGKKLIAKNLLDIVRYFQNPVEQSHWVKKISRELEVDEKAISETVQRGKAPAQDNLPDEKKEETSPFLQKRADVIVERIVGYMIADPNTWKEGIAKCADVPYLNTHSFFRCVAQGPEVQFQFENLLPRLEDEELKQKLQKLYFETRYRAENGEIKESDTENFVFFLPSYLEELRKELLREKMHTILSDIRKAEQAGDKEGLQMLMGEFSKISQELK